MPAVHSSNAPAAIGPYSQAIKIDKFVFVSGQLGINAATGEMAVGVEKQAAQALENIRHILREAGLDMAHVVKTTVYLQRMSDFAAMNTVYAGYFKEPFPARAAIEVAKLPKDGLVEIEAVAFGGTSV